MRSFKGESEAAQVTTWLNSNRVRSNLGNPRVRRVLNFLEVLLRMSELSVRGTADAELCRLRNVAADISSHFPAYEVPVDWSDGKLEFAWYSAVRGVPVNAIAGLIGLAKLGLIDRLRTCRACGSFFFAKSGASQTCSSSCKEKKRRTTEHYRVRRRYYNRWFYQQYLSPNAPRRKVPFESWLEQEKSKEGKKNAKRR